MLIRILSSLDFSAESNSSEAIAVSVIKFGLPCAERYSRSSTCVRQIPMTCAGMPAACSQALDRSPSPLKAFITDSNASASWSPSSRRFAMEACARPAISFAVSSLLKLATMATREQASAATTAATAPPPGVEVFAASASR